MAIFKYKQFSNFLCYSVYYKNFSLNCSLYSYASKFNYANLIREKYKLIAFIPKRALSLSSSLTRKVYTRIQKKGERCFSNPDILEEQENEDELEDIELHSLFYKRKSSFWDISSIAVLQPWIKWGPQKRFETTQDLLLDEACSLVRSLPFVKVTYKESISLQRISKAHVFGTGTLTRLKNEIRESNSEAVFISLPYLTRVQKQTLEDVLGVKVFDRFFIVLAIFKHHASSLEARLQIAMAELPLMSKEHLNEKDRLLLNQKETKLKEALARLEKKRETFRKSRKRKSIPSVAVVGYTNCGKTTLIRALTGDERAQGKDRLFATLDATCHKGTLPCGLSVLFMDTVGFIQNISTTLIASFRATLSDAVNADVVVVVRDVSHPDYVSQTNTVRATLRSLPLPADTPLIVVNNKADLLRDDDHVEDSILQEGPLVSSTEGDGLTDLLAKIESEVLRITDRKLYTMRLSTGSPRIEWLREHCGVSSEEVDSRDPQYTVVRVVMNSTEKASFQKAFQLNLRN